MSDINKSSNEVSQSKIIICIGLSILLFLTYSFYLFFLQLVNGSEYQQRAVTITRQVEKLYSQRGEIYDRNYNMPLVLNTDVFTVTITPAEVPSDMRDTVFQRLAMILDENLSEIEKKVPKNLYNSFKPISLSSTVNLDVVTQIAERIDEYPGVSWYSVPNRNYLETGSLAHIIGYVGEITSDELKVNYNRGYQQGDMIGKSGIERQYDYLLRGKDGKQFKTVDARGRKVTSDKGDVVPPQSGKNVVLTIDTDTQKLAEKALGERVGSIVVLKPATGEILAMVSYPYFNPNAIVNKGGNNVYARLLNDGNAPLINRSIQSSYPPGSTFKTTVSAGILEEKCFSPEEKVLCKGEIEYGDRVFRCHIRVPGHGYLDLKNAFGQSCDIYYWEVGRDKLGIERIVMYAKEFGLGQATGIDLPGEVEGFIPTPQWKERTYNEKWLGGDTLNTVIGQGAVLATPLQIADMLAMVVNEGVIYKPHLLKEIRDPVDGTIIQQTTPEVHLSSSISKDTFKTLKTYLRGVVETGSARNTVSTRAVKVGGKTGTAEVGYPDRWHSWFVGYGPTDAVNPEDVIVVSVIVEAVNPWEWWSPVATNIIFQGHFADQTYEEVISTLHIREHNTTITTRME